MAGLFVTVNGAPRPYLARFNEDGSLDESFYYRPALSDILSILPDADGTLLVLTPFGIQRLDQSGTQHVAAPLRSFRSEGLYAKLLSAKDGNALLYDVGSYVNGFERNLRLAQDNRSARVGRSGTPTAIPVDIPPSDPTTPARLSAARVVICSAKIYAPVRKR